METHRTLSRRALTVQDMTVDSAIKPILPPIDTPRCDLRPTPGTATEVANEEKREVPLHIRTRTMVRPTNVLCGLVRMSIPCLSNCC